MAYARLALLLLLMASSVVGAQPPRAEDSIDSIHLNESNQLGTRFRNAEARAAQGQWSEAIEEYQRILLDAGDELAPVDKHHVVQARWLAQARLSALPPEALTLYRSRIDPPAKKLLEQARALRDPALLHRIVDESFCSSFTDQALDLLGDLAFERGDFQEAEQLWRMIVRPASQPSSAPVAGLAVTDSRIDVASIRAKQILARLFRGESAGLSLELQAFAKVHPAAKGKLAGRQGLYVDILRTLAKQTGELGTPVGTEGWPQFAGANERNRVLPKVEGRLAHLPCPEGPAWQVRLDGSKLPGREERQSSDKPEKISSWTERSRMLGYYPSIVGDRVVVANAFHVSAYQLSTGERKLNYNLESSRDVASKAQVSADVSFPVAVVGDRVYARLGDKEAGPLPTQRAFGGRRRGGFGGFDAPPRDPPPQTYLVCLTMQSILGHQEVWGQQPPAPGEQRATVAFEGAPIVHQNRVYIAATQFLSGQIRSLVLCYDGDTGALHWQREVCMTSAHNDGDKRGRHHLLTLAGPNIVYCSHSGAIVAVDAITGQVRWGVRYASRGPKTADGQASFRSLVPCCYADGRVYAAPLDFDRVLCLDSRTGLTLWESDPMEIIHLLGVGRGKLFCTTLTPRCGLRALDAATGSGGWMQPGDDSSLPTFGRGLLAGDLIFWPTRDGLHVLRQADGEPVAMDEGIRGNLAASDGCLISADDHFLSAYLPEKWALRKRTQEAAQDGADASTFYRLGLAEMDAGLVDRARTSLKRAWKDAQDQNLRDLSLAKLHELLLHSAQASQPGGNGAAAETLLAEASAEPFLPAQRTRALALLAKISQEKGIIEQAINAWQTILETPALGSATLAGQADFPEQAAVVAAEAISDLMRRHGRNVYDAIDVRAEQASQSAANRAEADQRLQREFPQSLATVRSLEAAAARAEKQDRPWEAAAACRLLLDIPDAPVNRMQVFAGLARAYEREGCYEPMRAVLDQMENEGGGRQEAALHPVLSVRDWVRERRRALPQAQSRPAGQTAYVNRRWQATGIAHGSSQLSESGDMLFRLAGDKLDCLSTSTGKSLWTQRLDSAADWLGTSADLLVVAGKREITCLRQGDGAQVWRRDFNQAENAVPGGLQIAGGRLCFFLGSARFCALDIARGRCLWCEWAPASRLHLAPPGGQFEPNALVAGLTCVLSTGLGKPLMLDGRTGSRIHREWNTQGEAWPISTDGENRFGLVAGRESLQAIDMASGLPAWQFRFENPQALSGEMPGVLHRDDRVFVQIPYNYGYLLEYLDGKTGKRAWPVATFVGSRPLDLDLGDVDETTLYCAGPAGIEARALADGRILWRKATGLAPLRRKVERNGAALLCQSIAKENSGWKFTWLGLELRISPLGGPDSRSAYCSVEILDPGTGQIQQSLNVPLPSSTQTNLAVHGSSVSPVPQIKSIGRAASRLLVTSDRLFVMQGQAATAFDLVPDPGQSGVNGSP